MALIEMIPKEYWRQIRQELNALDWVTIDAEERAKREGEKEKVNKAYKEAIERRSKAIRRERNRRNYALRKTNKCNNN